jgi:hypothetical protein
MRPHPARRELLAATPTAFHPRPLWAATLNFRIPPSRVYVVGTCRPLRAYGEMRAHLAPSKLGAATPTAFHPRPSWAPDEIECRVLLMLPYTNLTPALAASLRHTMTAERQSRVVALRKVNILAAAPTDRHAGGASRMAGVIEQPVFGRGFLQFNYSILRLFWNGTPHFPRACVPQDQSPETSEGCGCGRFDMCATVCAARVGVRA